MNLRPTFKILSRKRSVQSFGSFSILVTFVFQKITHEAWASLVDQLVKNPKTMWKTWVQPLGWEDPMEKGKATHSSILPWRILRTVYSVMDRGEAHWLWQIAQKSGQEELPLVQGVFKDLGMYESESPSDMSDPLWPHGLYNPWNSPGHNTGVGSFSLLQEIFPTQGLNPGLPHCRQMLYRLSYQGSLIQTKRQVLIPV